MREVIFSVRPGVPCMQYMHHVLIVLKFIECDRCTFPFSELLWGNVGLLSIIVICQTGKNGSKPGVHFRLV